MAIPKRRKRLKGRRRIVGFSFKTNSGYRQSINEEDHFDRRSFLKERRDFKKAGIRIKDRYSRKPYVPYRER